MHFSLCLAVIAAFSTCTQAFYPYNLQDGSPSGSETTRLTVGRRFAGKPPTLGLRKRAVRRDDTYTIVEANAPTLPNSAALDQDGLDYSYFSVVEVGSEQQQMWLALDTGAPDTWVFDASCTEEVCTSHHMFDESSSTSFTPNGSGFSLGYGTGTIAGKLGNDTMSLAGLSVQLVFGMATSASDFFEGYPFDGILGMGRSGTDGWDMPSFMDLVAEAGYLGSNIVGFTFSRMSDNPKDGEINFGDVDTTKFQGNITYTATDADNWCIPLDDAYVNGQAVGFSGKSTTIDTGTSYILLPTADAQQLFSHIPGYYQNGEKFHIPCNTTALLQFSFSGVQYSISPLDYVTKAVGGGCVSTIVGHQSGDADTWLVGDVFLKNVYTVFDYDNATIGFAQRADASAATATYTPVASILPSATSTTTGSATSETTTTTSTSTSTSTSTNSASRVAHGVGLPLLTFLFSALFV